MEPNTGTEPYSLIWPVIFLSGSTLLYLLLDMFLLSKRFLKIFQTLAFYLLWLVYVVLALIAYGAIRVSSMAKIQGFVEHPQIAQALLLVLSVLAALTVVPSFRSSSRILRSSTLGSWWTASAPLSIVRSPIVS